MRKGAPSPRKLDEVGVEDVLDMHMKAVACARIGLEHLRQIAVDLDHVQALGALEQSPGQCAAAGADLDDALAGGGRDGVDDAADDLRIMQKMLAESLTDRHVLGQAAGLDCRETPPVNSMASAKAARRLPASALPRSRQAQRGSMIDAGAQNRQAQRHVHGIAESHVLDHRQTLVVVHGDDDIGRLRGSAA